MAQIKTGKVNVENGSAFVTGVDTTWISDDVESGNEFTVAGDGVLYTIASVNSNTELQLSAPYAGETSEEVSYTIARDFTTPSGINLMEEGDIETAAIFTRAMRKIQTELVSREDIAALASAGIYFTIQEGLDGTDDGEFFFVPNTQEGTYTLYQNDNGSASEQITFSSFSLIEQQVDLAEGFKNLAERWANEDEDVVVENDEFSSKHYSIKSSSSADAAALSESNAATSETSASDSADAASLSESNAATSESNASNSADAAALSESNAATSESNASTSETNASNSADAAALSESNAGVSETNAADSATTAQNARDKAQEWADAALGVEVEVDKFSARHWAEQLESVPETAYNWKGDWQAGEYNAGDAVFHQPTRSSYITLVTTSDEPDIDGNSDWQLLSRAAEFIDADFVILNDTPDGYVGDGGKYVRVTTAEDGLEFGTPTAQEVEADPEGSADTAESNANSYTDNRVQTEAKNADYDNTASGLSAETINDAIDEAIASTDASKMQYSVSTTTVDKTLVDGERCFVETAGLVITLPVSPSEGSIVSVSTLDFDDTTIGRNGEKIMGLEEDMILDSNYSSVTLVYTGIDFGWRIK